MTSPAEIATLAEFYDRYANALERTSPDQLQARRQFYARFAWLQSGVDRAQHVMN